MPVAHVMGTDHAHWSCHAHKGAEIDKAKFQPAGHIKRVVDKQAVHPDRVACADGDGGKGDHHGGGVPRGVEGYGGEGASGMGEPPQGFGCVPDDAAIQCRVGQGGDAVGGDQDQLAPAGGRVYS